MMEKIQGTLGGGGQWCAKPTAAVVSWNVSRGTHTSNVEYRRGHTTHLHEVMCVPRGPQTVSPHLPDTCLREGAAYLAPTWR